MPDVPADPRGVLLDAIVAALRAHAPLCALIGGADHPDAARIYDQVPEHDPQNPDTGKPPYVYVGPILLRRQDGGAGRGRVATIRVFAVSTDFGRLEAAAVGFAVIGALEHVELMLPEPYVSSVAVDHVQDGDVTDPDMPKSVFCDFETNIQWPTEGDQ